MPKTSATLREQLIEARDKVHRQLEILAAGPADFQWQPGLMDELRSVLAQLNKQIAELDGDRNPE